MKKIFFALMLLAGYANAQCLPDTTLATPGIYPDSATNFVGGLVGQPYEQIVTAVVPQDTCVVIVAGYPCQTVTIDSILVMSVTGLPPNFTYECGEPNCAFYGGEKGCMRIYSTSDPTPADIGTYNLQIVVTTYSVIQQNTDINYYKIVISDTTVGINQINNASETFALGQNSPNPAFGVTNIGFNSNKNTFVNFQVVNLLGDVVYQEKIIAKIGSNNISYNVSGLKSGIYLYSIDNGSSRYSKKMIVH